MDHNTNYKNKHLYHNHLNIEQKRYIVDYFHDDIKIPKQLIKSLDELELNCLIIDIKFNIIQYRRL